MLFLTVVICVGGAGIFAFLMVYLINKNTVGSLTTALLIVIYLFCLGLAWAAKG
jgi:hypothetical protein